ncbi:unnamed protein product [Enterobius vermicularis]|uniref:rRNA methyltransferase 2, mitochondrial n=1 Tax=Enterobius vermicularis TaxID=51028 RepID=A0A0N4UT10_ENTVE|nr:unnamed protein product [Enterobius vermicularis]
MALTKLENVSPVVYVVKEREDRLDLHAFDATVDDPIDAREVFDLLRDINDPEHPLTLEQLNVIQEELITVETDDGETIVDVRYVPTIPHCSMATLIGLAIRVKLSRSLHPSIRVIVRVNPGTHNTADAINKQLADKERVAAAMENPSLMQAAREHNYRARSAFKLLEINEKYHIIKPGYAVVDLGAAPGSWCQVLLELLKIPEEETSYVLGVDLQYIHPLPGVRLLSLSDVTEQSTRNKIKDSLNNRDVDVVLSDMAPNPTGDGGVDHERIINLCKKATDLFCHSPFTINLKESGTFLCKIWDGSRRTEFIQYLKQYFKSVNTVKPKSSRDFSAEMYLLSRGFKYNEK